MANLKEFNAGWLSLFRVSWDYKSRFSIPHILPLMQFFEINGILSLIRSLKFPSSAVNIYNYITFNASTTWSSSNHELIHKHSTSFLHYHFYFRGKILPSIDLNLSLNIIKKIICRYFWNRFETNFDCNHVHTLCPCNLSIYA